MAIVPLKIRSRSPNGPCQANLIFIAYASSEGSGEPAHLRSLARTSAARSYKQWVKRNLQTESQIPGPSEWLDMRSYNLSWRNARRHKFTWRGSNDLKLHFASMQKIHQYLYYKPVENDTSLVTRKPVFRVCDKVRHKLACPATEARQRIEISHIETRGIILSK